MRILGAEDLYVLRDGVVRLLEAYGHEVVGTATTGPETLEALRTLRPDVSVIAVRMPPTSDEGLRAALARTGRRRGDGDGSGGDRQAASQRLDRPRLDRLTGREHEVLSLMAEGVSNQAIARRLFLSGSAISKYTTSLFGKLGITDDENGNRRVLAVLTYLNRPG